MPTLPAGTVTFLFTDVEASTRNWEERPAEMQQALEAHDALLRRTIEAYGGAVFKTIGDAFCAAFATAPDALAAALEIQRKLQNDPDLAAGHPALRVRMALHTGAAQLRDGDYFGASLSRVARVLSAGHGGQVLLTEPTHELVRDTLQDSVTLRLLGEYRLAGLSRPETIFQLRHPELIAEFPPLRSLEAPAPTNLPQQLTAFIGREREIAEVKAALGACRLLTLVGSGGCGKTRLMLQVAEELLHDATDGVWLVELAAISDGARVCQALASTLGVREEPGRLLSDSLVAHLKEKRCVLLFDNCEHLLEASAQLIEPLLRYCPGVRVLATSREGLGIAGETRYRVPGLSLPDVNAELPAEALSQYEAIRLWLERARAVAPDFAASDSHVVAVASICRHLDGIPLAIELAAARAGTLSVAEISRRLDDRFRLLTGGSRTALPRQQTLRAAMDWSYDLLSRHERALFNRLWVFAGGWTLPMAEAVCAGGELDAPDILDILTGLVDKSLVVADTARVETRYRMLETIGQYSQERSRSAGEEAELRDRHLDYFVAFATEAEPQLTGPDQARWYESLETEHDNLRAALQSSLNRPLVGLRLCSALWRFWHVRGYYTEGREWCTAMLKRSEAAEETPDRAGTLTGAGVLASDQSAIAEAEALLQESLAVSRRLADNKGISSALVNLGITAWLQSDYAAARARWQESLALDRESGDRRRIAVSLQNLGIVAREQADFEAAQQLFAECLAIYRELGDRRSVALTLNSQALVACACGHYTAARSQSAESALLATELGDRYTLAHAVSIQGRAAQGTDDLAEAQRLQERSLEMFRELGDRGSTAMSLNQLGILACISGNIEAACALLRDSLAVCQQIGDKKGIAEAIEAWAQLALATDQPEQAVRAWAAVECLRRDINSPLPPLSAAARDTQLAMAREKLGDKRFVQAWADGLSTSAD